MASLTYYDWISVNACILPAESLALREHSKKPACMHEYDIATGSKASGLQLREHALKRLSGIHRIQYETLKRRKFSDKIENCRACYAIALAHIAIKHFGLYLYSGHVWIMPQPVLRVRGNLIDKVAFIVADINPPHGGRKIVQTGTQSQSRLRATGARRRNDMSCFDTLLTKVLNQFFTSCYVTPSADAIATASGYCQRLMPCFCIVCLPLGKERIDFTKITTGGITADAAPASRSSR